MNSSLLELCEREEWNVIIESMHEMIHVWDFDERNAADNTPLHICCEKGSLSVLQHLQQFKKFKFKQIMNAAIYEQKKTVIWMLSNGSSISENTIKTTSCENMMKANGIYQALSRIYKSKSSRK